MEVGVPCRPGLMNLARKSTKLSVTTSEREKASFLIVKSSHDLHGTVMAHSVIIFFTPIAVVDDGPRMIDDSSFS